MDEWFHRYWILNPPPKAILKQVSRLLPRERELTTLLSEDEQIERLRNHTSLVVAPSHLPHQEPKFDGRNRPMSGGFAAVMLALSVCGEVDLYGFSGGGGNHYYPKLTAIKDGCTVRLSAPRHRSCCLS
jgi:hypothetical protein